VQCEETRACRERHRDGGLTVVLHERGAGLAAGRTSARRKRRQRHRASRRRRARARLSTRATSTSRSARTPPGRRRLPLPATRDVTSHPFAPQSARFGPAYVTAPPRRPHHARLYGWSLRTVQGRTAARTGRSRTRRLQAENYDLGGAGVAYNDTTRHTAAPIGRTTSTSRPAATRGGYNVGWTVDGECSSTP